ncbi:MAG: hypothetical protein ACI35S_06690 [Anaeroplasma sp.]
MNLITLSSEEIIYTINKFINSNTHIINDIISTYSLHKITLNNEDYIVCNSLDEHNVLISALKQVFRQKVHSVLLYKSHKSNMYSVLENKSSYINGLSYSKKELENNQYTMLTNNIESISLYKNNLNRLIAKSTKNHKSVYMYINNTDNGIKELNKCSNEECILVNLKTNLVYLSKLKYKNLLSKQDKNGFYIWTIKINEQ